MTHGHEQAFKTHSNYIAALHDICLYPKAMDSSKKYEYLAKKILENESAALGIKRHRNLNLDRKADLKNYLTKSWNTEFLMATTADLIEDFEIMSLSLSWLTIQSYYSMHASVTSVLVANRLSTPSSHEKGLSAYVELWSKWSDSELPWSFMNTKLTQKEGKSSEYINGPGFEIDWKVNSWTVPQGINSWNLVGKALRSTRQKEVEKALQGARQKKGASLLKEFENENRNRAKLGKRQIKNPPNRLPRLTEMEKVKVQNKVRDYSILDYIYRLRLDANYEKEQRFSEGAINIESASEYIFNIRNVLDAFLLSHEIRVIAAQGFDNFQEIYTSWSQKNVARKYSYGIQKRMKFYELYFN